MSDVPAIPQANIDMLKENPEMNRSVFDRLYGQGAADRVLGGTQRVNPNRKPSPDDVEEDNESWVGWAYGESLGAVTYGVQEAVNETLKAYESFDEWIYGTVLKDVPARFVVNFDNNGEFTWDFMTHKEASDSGASNFLLGEIGKKRDALELDIVDAPETLVGSGVAGISQFITGIIGVGKITKLKGIYGALVNGAIADALVFNPNDANISKMVSDFGVDTGAFGELMATDPDDPEWQNRLRNAGEGTMIGGLVEGIAYGVRAIKLRNQGRYEEAEAADKAAIEASRKVEAELVKEGKALSDDIGQTLSFRDRMKDVKAQHILKDALDDAGVPTKEKVEITTVPPEQARRLTPDEIGLIREVAGIKSLARNNNPKITPNLAEGLGITRKGAIKAWEDVLPYMAAIRQVIKTDWDQAAGTKASAEFSKLQAAKAAREMAELTGENPDELYARFKGGLGDTQEMHIEIAARGLVTKALLQRVNKMEDYIASGKWNDKDWKGYKTRADLIEDYENAITLAAALIKEYSATRSAAGRTLQATKNTDTEGVNFAQIEEMRGNVEMFAKQRAADRARGTKRSLEETKREVSKVRQWLDKINAYRVNALLSGPGTQEVNLISTMLNTIKIPTEQVVGGAMKGDARIMMHGIRTMRGMIASSFDAIAMMKQAWDESDAVLDTINKVEDDARAEIWKPLQMPSRMLLAMDELFKQSAYRGRVIADALEAADTALLKGKDRDEFVRGYLADSFDEAGKATREGALLQAQRSTFTQPLEQGSWGRWVQDSAARYPLVRFVAPFVRTPINILSEATQMMPVLNRISRRRKDDLAAGGLRAAQSNGKLAVGYALSITAVTLAADDRITGSGPKDPRLRKAWIEAGNRPYSLKFEKDDGTTEWVSFARYEPASQIMSIVADWVEIYRDEYEENEAAGLRGVVGGLLQSFAENSVNKTFTQGIHDFFTLVAGNDPNRANNAINQMAASFVPNFLNQTNGDMAFRETRTLMDTIMSRTPSYGKVDPKRNMLGEVMFRQNPKYDPLSIMSVDVQPNDPVSKEIWEVAKGAQTVGGLPSRFMDDVPGEPGGRLDLSKIPYAEGQSLYDRFVELTGTVKINGRTMREELDRLFKTQQYQNMMPGTDGMNKGTRAYAIGKVVSAYRKQAKSELPELRELERTRLDQQNQHLFKWRREKSRTRQQLFPEEQPVMPGRN